MAMRWLLAVLLTGCAAHPGDPFLELDMVQPAETRVSQGRDVIAGSTGKDFAERFIQWDDEWDGHPLTWQLVVRGTPGKVADLADKDAAGFHWLEDAEDCRPTQGTVSWKADDVIEFAATCPDGTPLRGALLGRLVSAEWSARP